MLPNDVRNSAVHDCFISQYSHIFSVISQCTQRGDGYKGLGIHLKQ